MTKQDRYSKFFAGNVPRYIRCYDNGGDTADQYSIVFTGNYRGQTNGSYLALGSSENPFGPMGVGQHCESQEPFDRPGYSHLGKKVKFEDLPEKVQQFTLQEYKDLWDLN